MTAWCAEAYNGKLIYNMDLQQYSQKLGQYADILSKGVVQSIIVPAANELLATTKNRIIKQGKATDNSSIGNYSNKAAYFSQKTFVNKGAFKPQGKVRSGTKSMYLPQGYAQFRSIQGRETGFINLNLSGDSMNRYQLSAQDKAVIFGMTTKKASDIRKGQEKKRGKNIYASTKQELDAYNKNVAGELAELATQIFR